MAGYLDMGYQDYDTFNPHNESVYSWYCPHIDCDEPKIHHQQEERFCACGYDHITGLRPPPLPRMQPLSTPVDDSTDIVQASPGEHVSTNENVTEMHLPEHGQNLAQPGNAEESTANVGEHPRSPRTIRMIRHHPKFADETSATRTYCRDCHTPGHSAEVHEAGQELYDENGSCYRCHVEGHSATLHQEEDFPPPTYFSRLNLMLHPQAFKAGDRIDDIYDVYNCCAVLENQLQYCINFVRARDKEQKYVLELAMDKVELFEIAAGDALVARLTNIFDQSNIAVAEILQDYWAMLRFIYKHYLIRFVTQDLVQFRNALQLPGDPLQWSPRARLSYMDVINQYRFEQGLGVHVVNHDEVQQCMKAFSKNWNRFRKTLINLDDEVQLNDQQSLMFLKRSNYACKPYMMYQLTQFTRVRDDDWFPKIWLPATIAYSERPYTLAEIEAGEL